MADETVVGNDIESNIKFLSGDDEPEVKVEIPEETEEESVDLLKDSDEEKSEEDDEEKKEEEEIDEEPEDLEIAGPIRRKEILAKYPNLFKEFPALESAYYREQKYAEILPTIEDAKEAAERSQTLAAFEAEVGKGNIDNLLESVKKTDSKAFAKIVDNYLPNLQKVDQGAYNHILGNIFSNAVASMYTEGKRIDNEQLQQAAALLNQFIFGTADYKAPSNFAKTSPQDDEVAKERNQFKQERFNVARNELATKAGNAVKSTIAANIDPKEVMPDYVKRNAIRDCQEALDNAMGEDSRFRAVIDKLWEKAANDNYSPKAMAEIQKAYVSKARTLLPGVLAKTRNEALKGLKVTSRPEKDRKGPLTQGRSTTPIKSGNSREAAKEIPKGMSSRDYLMRD